MIIHNQYKIFNLKSILLTKKHLKTLIHTTIIKIKKGFFQMKEPFFYNVGKDYCLMNLLAITPFSVDTNIV